MVNVMCRIVYKYYQNILVLRCFSVVKNTKLGENSIIKTMLYCNKLYYFATYLFNVITIEKDA